LNPKGWAELLQDDIDRDFIMNGVTFGFDIIDPNADPLRAEMDNHPSASPSNPLYDLVSKQVNHEICCGNYVPSKSVPVIVSPLGAIPKSDGGVRLIHDCSRPAGLAVNDYVENTDSHRFHTDPYPSALIAKELQALNGW
jgi:hypothetical protein